MFGGFDATGICNDLWSFNFPSLTWRPLHPLGSPLPHVHYAKMLVYKGKVYIFGGFDGSKNLTDVFAYTPDTNHLARVNKDMPGVRGFALVLYRDHAYVFGGFSRTSRLTNALFEYSFGPLPLAPLPPLILREQHLV